MRRARPDRPGRRTDRECELVGGKGRQDRNEGVVDEIVAGVKGRDRRIGHRGTLTPLGCGLCAASTMRGVAARIRSVKEDTMAKVSSRVYTCLWFDHKAEEAASLYVSLIPDSRIDAI